MIKNIEKRYEFLNYLWKEIKIIHEDIQMKRVVYYNEELDQFYVIIKNVLYLFERDYNELATVFKTTEIMPKVKELDKEILMKNFLYLAYGIGVSQNIIEAQEQAKEMFINGELKEIDFESFNEICSQLLELRY